MLLGVTKICVSALLLTATVSVMVVTVAVIKASLKDYKKKNGEG